MHSFITTLRMFFKPKPPPQNFRVIHQPVQDSKRVNIDVDKPIIILPPNVYMVPNVPVEKPGPNWLRVVCISDTHNTTDINNFPIPDADVLIHAGDFTKMGTTAQIDQFICWMKSLTNIPLKIIIAGNHDLTLEKEFYKRCWTRFHSEKEDQDAAVNMLRTAGNGIVYLDNESCNIDGAEILYKKWQKNEEQNMKGETLQQIHAEGAAAAAASETAAVDPRQGWVEGYKVWGSPWQPEFFNWAFGGERGKLHEIWKLIPTDTDILITHGPPEGHGDIVESNLHVGCSELFARLKDVKPLYHIFGHIHEGYGVSQIEWPPEPTIDSQQLVSPTICINASTCTIRYRPLNSPIIVDLPPK